MTTTTTRQHRVGDWVRHGEANETREIAAIDGNTAHLATLSGQPAGTANLADLRAVNVLVVHIKAKSCCGGPAGEDCACGEIARAPEFTIH